MAQKHTHRGLLDGRHGVSLAFFRFGLRLRHWRRAIALTQDKWLFVKDPF